MELLCCLSMVVFLSIEDIKKRQVSLWKLILFIPISVFFVIHHGKGMLYNSFLGFMIGLLFIMISLITNGKLGIADAVTILFIGIITGYEIQLRLLFYSFTFSFGIAIIACFVHRSKKMAIPFIPCILIGNLILILERELG